MIISQLIRTYLISTALQNESNYLNYQEDRIAINKINASYPIDSPNKKSKQEG